MHQAYQDLHSNMVRFKDDKIEAKRLIKIEFTFQYGKIQSIL